MKSNPLALIRSFVGLLYIGLGIYIWKTKSFVVPLSETSAFALGLVMGAYGLFRCYTSYQSFRNKE
jgi:hypothetical protein